METYAPDLLIKAEEIAREMISTGETLKDVFFGHKQGRVWISSEKNMVVVDKIIEVDGKQFFIGLFKK
jgi:hypothetical protein